MSALPPKADIATSFKVSAARRGRITPQPKSTTAVRRPISTRWWAVMVGGRENVSGPLFYYGGLAMMRRVLDQGSRRAIHLFTASPPSPRQYRAALGLNIHPGLLHLRGR
jgi:hypothetical protein